MAWNLYLAPQGLLLSKYVKNSIILNPQNVNLVGQNQVLGNSYQTFNPSNNTVDLVFSLQLVNDDPRSDQPQPNIIGFNKISISNDPNFVEIFTLLPKYFSGNYSNITDYICDLTAQNINSLPLPNTYNFTFDQKSGSGNIIINGWPLSNSSGAKRIFFNFNVLLSDGTSAQFPNNLSGYDEIYVLSDLIYSPTTPVALNSYEGYVGTPVILTANTSSSSGLIGSTDLSITSYFWDNLLLTSTNNCYRNNTSVNNYLFNNAPISNKDSNIPASFTIASSNNIGNAASYADYISSNAFQLTASNNVYWSEIHYKLEASPNYSSGAIYFLENNLVNSTNTAANTKFLRQQFVADISTQNLTIYTSIDDSTWSSNANYIPNINYTSQTIFNPELVSKIFQGGTIITLVEIIDTINNIFQVKSLYKTDGEASYVILNEQIFSSSLAVSTNIYCELRCYVRNASTTITVESSQYGIAYGVISASVTPSEKISPQQSLPYYYNFANQDSLNTWFKLYNSSNSGTISYNSQNDYSGSLLLYSNSSNPNNNNLTLIEAQSSIPTFSLENTLSVEFYTNTNGFSPVKVGWSVDSNIDFNNFTFSDSLTQVVGQTLPQSLSQYNIFAQLAWNNTAQYDLYCADSSAGDTCSIANPLATNLFYYTANNPNATLTSPAVIKTRGNLTNSDTFSYYINTNGNSSANIISQEVTVNNVGKNTITVNAKTVNPGDSYTINAISQNSFSPTSVAVTTTTTSITNSINFLYDFSTIGTIQKFSINIQVANPPDCPTTLPDFKYSVETSPDFITWTNYASSGSPSTPYVTLNETFDVKSGRMLITFTLNAATNTRYIRLRIYGGAANGNPTLDPTINSYNYYIPVPDSGSSTSNLINFTPNKSINMNGKFVFGLTDTSAKNISLGQYYNQPTLLRTLTGVSNIVAFALDFTNYSSDSSGPVDINLITTSGEYTIHTIYSGFAPSVNSTAVAKLTLIRSDIDDGFKLVPILSIKYGSIDLSFAVPQYQSDPGGSTSIAYGYYPFISLSGNGYIIVTNASNVVSNYNYLENSNNATYFNLYSAQNSDYSSSYGKNLLAQNVLNQSAFSFPLIGAYFTQNQVTTFSYNPPITAPIFNVKSAITSPVSLYGLTYADGVYLNRCDFILVAGQQDKTQNGVYQVQYQQWVKYNLSSNENTIYVQQGNIFGDTLWLEDLITGEWIPNVIQVPLYLSNNQLLTAGISTYLNYPQYIRVAITSFLTQNTNSVDQVKVKLVNSPKGYITDTDASTQWNSLLQNNYFSNLTEKGNANNTIFSNFAISSSQISGITTVSFPSSYNLLISFAGNNNPLVTQGSSFNISNYGTDYRMFKNPDVIYQAFSTYDTNNIAISNNNYLTSAVYAINEAGIKSPQSGFSSSYIVDSVSPALGILSSISDSGKIVLLGLSTVIDSGSGLNLARIVQKNPIDQLIYGSWFSMNDASYYGVSTFAAYPSFVADNTGLVAGEPLSGFYRYSLQVSDNIGNISQTNEVESFYIESALVDTQGPIANVSFVNKDYATPISITSSTSVVAQLNALDIVSGVKAFRYRILPDQAFSNWIDYDDFTNIYLPDDVADGIVSAEFQFKDFANNVLQSNSTNDQNTFTYTWNIISKILNNCTFTVIERATYSNNPVLLIGASQNNSATLFVWNGAKLIQVVYSGLIYSNAVTAMKNVHGSVIIGDNLGKTYLYTNGLITGPFANFKIGGISLPISKFEIHTFSAENTEYVYASTLNYPRLFRTLSSNLTAGIWQQVSAQPITLQSINVINSGLWSGNTISYSVSSTYVPAQLTPVYSYGVGSVIVVNSGSNYKTIPQISATNLSGAQFNVVLKGSLGQLQVFNPGVGYTAGATVQISAPPAGLGTVQASATITTSLNSSIFSISLTNPGYGYTTFPAITVVGNGGFGSGAVIIPANSTNSINYDSIYSVSVSKAGIGTTSNISLTVTSTGFGTGAILAPSLIYRVGAMNIVNPGFGYTSTPQLLINGLSTIANVIANNGSIQSVNVYGEDQAFNLDSGFNYTLSGGFATSVIISISTSSVSFSSNGLVLSGTVINSINVSGKSYGIGTIPYITFSNTIFDPQISYVFSDDLLLSGANGSIYDIKSFDDRLFLSNSINGIDFLDKNKTQFTLKNLPITQNSNDLNHINTYNLETFKIGVTTSLYFSSLSKPLVGTINRTDASVIFGKFQNNVLLYSPKNFDILSDWQLVKNYNVGGISTVSLTGINSNLLSIYTTNGQTFYQSTKNNIWFNRCNNNSSYGVTFIFEALMGTQAFEISNFSSQLNVTFTVESGGLLITFGNNTFTQVTTNIQPIYNITIIKDNSSIYINDNNLNIVLASVANFFAEDVQANPIIRFGYLYEPENVITNGNNSLILGYAQTSVSQFIWHSLQIGFNTSTPSNSLNYNVNTNYVFPNSDSVRVLRSLDGYLYAVSKSIHDQRTTTILSDLSSRIFRFDGSAWNDVTGNFENNLIGISSVYTIVSPNDINSLNGSYFLSGILNKITSKKQAQVSITVGLSTNSVYEEQNINAVILYPYNPNPAGTFLYLNGNSSIVSAPSSIYFGPQDLVKVVQIGLGSTSTATAASLSVTDGTSISTAGFTINPITISGVSLNTSSYVSYSNNVIISTVTLTAIPKTARTYQLTSSNSSILAVPNNGIQTVLAGSISSTTTLINGVATATTTQITINAIYRGISTALITDNPFVLTSTLSSGLNSGIFTGNQYYGKVIYTGTLSAAPQGNFPINVVSSAPTILGFPVGVVTVLPNAFSTSITMTIGAAVTASRSINITGVATGTISTASITAFPLLITSATADTYNPVIGLQTSYITYTLNTTPANNVTIVNIVSSPTNINMVYSGLSTVLGGTISTTFGLSTTIQASAIGLAITVQGAPFGFNTSPVPGIILSTEIWRITNLNVSPVTITGGANNSNGIAQSFIITANLNFSTSGLSTSITLSASSGVVGFNTTILLFNGTATSTGYATGFTTSLVTGVAITAYGPSGYSSTFSGLTVTPFLVNSFSVKPVWPYFTSGISTFNLIGGLGATAVGIVTLSAYVAAGVQTLSFSSAYSGLFIYNQSATYPSLGIATVYTNSNTAIVNLGAGQTSAYTSTSITATLQSSSLGIGTTTINIDSIPTYSLVFNPFLATSKTTFTLTLSKILPVSTSLGIAISNYNNTYTFNSNQLSGGYQLNIGSFKTDTVFNGFVTYLGSTQQYFISGFANSGGPFGMGYNYAGSLSRFNPNTGASGSALKYYMGLPNVVKTASGYTHNLALDNLGSVYAIGDNTYGQLGQVNLGSNNTSTFVRINFAYNARDIYAQNNSSYVITTDNSLWGFGDNSYYCLGTSVPASGASTAVPYLISTSVQLFSVFNYRGLVVTFNNQTGIQSVFEFGQYQSAVGLTSKNITQLTYNGSTRNISNLVISSIDVGPQHSVASGTWTDASLGISSSGVFAWGFNTSGQIGLATTTALTTIPNVLTKYDSSGSISPIEFSNLIFADSQFSLVVSESTPNNQGYVSGVSISSSGIGYTSGATVLFSAPPSAEYNYTAAGYAVTSGGYITSVSISSSGFGYTSGAVVLFSDPAAGIGTTSATGIAVTNNGQITSVTITNPGLGYTQAPTMTFIGNNGFGTLATGYTSISYAQVTSVVVTAPGFGYTQAPSFTISGNSGFGSGATGFAILSSNATNLNSLYVVGNTNSYNSIGLIVGLTTIATTNYFTPNSPIYKIAKDSQHYIWTLGIGSVYVTGGAIDNWPSYEASVKVPHFLNASNSYDDSAYITLDLVNGGYISVLFGEETNSYYAKPKKITQSFNIWASLNNTSQFPGQRLIEGGYEVVINSTNKIDISYVQNNDDAIVELWANYQNYSAQDISIGGYDGSYFTFGTRFPAKGYLYVLNIANSWTITLLEIQSVYNNTSTSYTPGAPFEIASSGFTSQNKPIFVDGSQIYGYAAASWGINQQSSSPPFLLNFVIGFDDGTVALYGFTDATKISEISSWSLGSSSVSCLKSLVVYGLRSTNRRWLFIATQNGDLYSYNAWGYGGDNGVGQAPFWFTKLEPDQALPLLASTNIISQNGSQFGYITLIEDYDGKLIIAATSTNYLLVIDIADLRTRAYIKVPDPITSIMWGSNSNISFPPSGVSNYIYVTTSGGSNFVYYFKNVRNYEIGLNYANDDGSVQLLTYDGSLTGLGMTNIFHASTNDTMTLVLDSSRPSG